MINAKNISFEYISRDENENILAINKALEDISINVKKGQFIAIIGGNGSGKSTFAKHLNALLFPTKGTVYIDGKNTLDEENLIKIRQQAGMVFQNPDNQIVGALVEEDVGFGPENLGLPQKEIISRVNLSLKELGISQFAKTSPNQLSGGQKQKVVIAGVLAMKPECIILDEPTSMLEPKGRKDVINAITRLNKQENITIILITHYLEEIEGADYVFVLNDGKLSMQGTVEEIYNQPEELIKNKLELPQIWELAWELKKEGLIGNESIYSVEDMVLALQKRKIS